MDRFTLVLISVISAIGIGKGAVPKLHVPESHPVTLGSDALIPCTFPVNSPPVDFRSVNILWYFRGEKILSYNNSDVWTSNPRFSLNTHTVRDGDASLSISNVTIPDGRIYKCSVTYGSDKKEKEVRLDVRACPQITVVNKVVVEGHPSILSISITGFFPIDIGIKWFREGELLNNFSVPKPKRNPGGTYRVNTSATIIPTEEDRHKNFSCVIQHFYLKELLQTVIQLEYGALPSIHINSQTFHENEEQTLICHVWGFYPESIALNWFLNGTHVETARTQRINSSAVQSVYRFLPTTERNGMEISCEVEHATLPSPLVKKVLVELIGAGPKTPDPSKRHRYPLIPAVIVLSVLLIICLLYQIQMCYGRTWDFCAYEKVEEGVGGTGSEGGVARVS